MDQVQSIVVAMGRVQAQMHATSIVMTRISVLDFDFMLGNEDKLKEEFDLCSTPKAVHLRNTSMSIIYVFHSDYVIENKDIPTEDVDLWSSLFT